MFDTSTTLTLAPATATYGAEETLTANINFDARGVGLGTVTFSDNGLPLGTVPTNLGESAPPNNLLVTLQATLPVGPHALVASYSGGYDITAGSDAKPSTSPVVHFVVAPAPLKVTADNGYRVVGGTDPTFAATYSGFVNSEGPSVLGGSLTITDGEAPDAAPGIYPGALVPSGLSSSNYAISFVPGTLVVGEGVASTTGLATPASTTFGQPVTFEATVAGDGPTPTGLVQFKVDGVDDGPPVAVAGDGTAVSPATTPVGGTHQIEADYQGDSNYAPSTGLASETVLPAGTTTVPTASASTITYGQAVTIDAALAAMAPGGVAPSGGSVQFSVDGVAFGPPVAVADSAASISIPSLTPGPHSITASYGGTNNFAPSSGSTSVEVEDVVTTTSVQAQPRLALDGRPITIAATVVGDGDWSSGTATIQFLVDGVDLGAPLPVDGQGATITTSALSPGWHRVQAVFSGGLGIDGSSASTTILILPSFRKDSIDVPTATRPITQAASTPVVFLGPGAGDRDEFPELATRSTLGLGWARTSDGRGPARRVL